MANTGPVREMIKERKEQREKAVGKLKDLVKNKINLKRPVFFVPGWTDEDNTCWKTASSSSPRSRQPSRHVSQTTR